MTRKSNNLYWAGGRYAISWTRNRVAHRHGRRRRMLSCLEALSRIREAGGKAWDGVADPDAAIREMRGEVQP